jgi:hypothetical protein
MPSLESEVQIEATKGSCYCSIHLATGCGRWEVPGPTYRMSDVLKSRGIVHHLDDWGPKGGHEWPSWHDQMWNTWARISRKPFSSPFRAHVFLLNSNPKRATKRSATIVGLRAVIPHEDAAVALITVECPAEFSDIRRRLDPA